MKRIIRLTENDLVRFVKRVIGEEEKQNLFPDAPTSSSKGSIFMFNADGAKGYYHVLPFSKFPDEFYKYVSSLGKDLESEVIDYLVNRIYIEASGEFNRIHFREGIHPVLQGLGIGYSIYEDFIKFLGYASSTDSATEDSKRVWKKLVKDPDFYGVYCNNGDVLAVYKNWNGDVPSLVKSFIRGRNDVSFISDNLLSDYPELNNDIKISESYITRIVKRVVKEEMDEYQRRELEDLHDDLLYLTPSYGGRNLGNAISIYREMKSIVGDSEVSEKAERLMSKIDNEISGLEGIHERIIQLYMELTGDNSFEEI